MTSSPAPVTPAQTKYYLKFLKQDRKSAYGGKGQWPAPGIWTEEVEPIPCKQGWHLCRKRDILRWMHETLWVVEADGDVILDPEENNKVVARRARLVRQVEEWNPRTQRLFAVDCAKRVLHHFESAHPDDDRPRKAIEVARRFALGEATEEELDAARSAAWSAARFAADAAWSAAETAAWSAAWSAARSAAWDAAWSAARSAERTWQIEHIFKEYLKLDPNDFH